ncbi:HD-GYP domain-containing protein [Halalkalibacterium halodurans]|nr:HD-GYP domain-containing protein [Halalkalibacterium halodurans]TES53677.1 HD-GYP domain-containing protein [Halalkalibacterium halodurans]TPE66375.1 HD-GYP domain-containing protein [Halalkalibacterium halodurans]
MKVKLNQLVPGCIVLKPIMAETTTPLYKEKTVLTAEDIQTLSKFLIDEIEVENVLANGEKFIPSDNGLGAEAAALMETGDRFKDRYMQAVANYKQVFQEWAAGTPVEMKRVRHILLPLFEEIVEKKEVLLQLHHYSTKEDYLYHHAVSVGLLSAFLGAKLGYEKGEWLKIALAGALADCGMAKLPTSLLTKNGLYTLKEKHEMRDHPKYSYQMLKKRPGIDGSLLSAVLQHHEREDGTGYPLGVRGQKIHFYAQILAVADVYHAMISERKYRKKKSPYMVLEDLAKERFGKFNPHIVHVLVSQLTQLSVRTSVRLTNNRLGEIVFIDPMAPTRPMVQLQNGEMIYLMKNYTVHIEDVLLS